MANPEHLKILRESIDRKTFHWNRWRKDNPELIPDLSRAHLSGLDLSWANLSGVNFHGTALSASNLRGVNLRDSILVSASLGGTQFFQADLSNADLQKAHIWWTDLRRATLSGANFAQTRCSFTIFDDIDLSEVIGLEAVIHENPSTLGISTLYHSRGNIPEVFMRGCGVPDSMIDFARTLVEDYHSCFISYSHHGDAIQFAKLLYDRLQGDGVRCWLDAHEMIPGQKIDIQLDRGLRSTEKTILLCSEASLKSWWVDQEIATSFEIERTMQKADPHDFRLIPINLDGFLFDEKCTSETTVTGGKLSQIKQRYVPDFTAWKDHDSFTAAYDILLRALKN